MNLSEFIPKDVLVIVYFALFVGISFGAAIMTLRGLVRIPAWLPQIATRNNVADQIQVALETQAEKHGVDKAEWQHELKRANDKIKGLEPLTKEVEQLKATVKNQGEEINRLTRDNLELHKTKDVLEEKNGKLKADNQTLAERTLVAEALRTQADEFHDGMKVMFGQLLQITQLLAQHFVIQSALLPTEEPPDEPKQSQEPTPQPPQT